MEVKNCEVVTMLSLQELQDPLKNSWQSKVEIFTKIELITITNRLLSIRDCNRSVSIGSLSRCYG